MKSSTLFERGPLPSYVHLSSTRRHSRDRCSHAFPVFRTLPLPSERKPKNKKRGRPGNEAMAVGFVAYNNHVPLSLGFTPWNWVVIDCKLGSY